MYSPTAGFVLAGSWKRNAQAKIGRPQNLMTCTMAPDPSRREFLSKSVKAFLSMVAVGFQVKTVSSANAAIPLLEEYTGGTGAVKRSGGSFLFDGKKSAKGGSNDDVGEEEAVTTWVLPESRQAFVSLVEESLVSLKACNDLIKKQQWDDLRLKLMDKDSTGLLYLQMRPMLSRLGYNPTGNRFLVDKAEELSTNLKVLDDLAFSNRVIFFNSADKRQIQQMKSEQDDDIQSFVEEDEQEKVNEALDVYGYILTLHQTLADLINSEVPK